MASTHHILGCNENLARNNRVPCKRVKVISNQQALTYGCDGLLHSEVSWAFFQIQLRKSRGDCTGGDKKYFTPLSLEESDKIDDFIELMRPIGLVEVSRTGVAAITRGPEGM